MKVNKTILAVFFASIIIATPNTLATSSCLTTQQEQTIQQLADSSNISYSALISIFDSICQQLDEKQTRTEAMLQYNMTKDYIDSKVQNIDNVTETLKQVNNSIENYLSAYITELNDEIAIQQTLANLSQAVKNTTELVNRLSSDTLKSVTSDVDDKISSLKAELDDSIDEKLSSQKKYYISKEDFDKFNSSITSKIENLKYSAPETVTTENNYTAYIFWGIVGLIAFGYVYTKFFRKPAYITKANISTEPIIQRRASDYKKNISKAASKDIDEEKIKHVIEKIKKEIDKTKETAKK